VTLIGLADAGRGRGLFLWVTQLIPAGDKCGHFVLFGSLAFLANAAMNGARFQLGSFTILKGSLFVLIPTVLEEFSQIFVSTRSFDLFDLAADFLGIFLGGLVAVLLLRYLNAWNSREPEIQLRSGATD
jgi:VanZ family protein